MRYAYQPPPVPRLVAAQQGHHESPPDEAPPADAAASASHITIDDSSDDGDDAGVSPPPLAAPAHAAAKSAQPLPPSALPAPSAPDAAPGEQSPNAAEVPPARDAAAAASVAPADGEQFKGPLAFASGDDERSAAFAPEVPQHAATADDAADGAASPASEARVALAPADAHDAACAPEDASLALAAGSAPPQPDAPLAADAEAASPPPVAEAAQHPVPAAAPPESVSPEAVSLPLPEACEPDDEAAAMVVDTTPVPSTAPDAGESPDADDGLDAPLSLPKRLAPSPLEARLASAVLRPLRPPSPPPPPLLADDTWFDAQGVATCSLEEVPQLPKKQLEACLRHMQEDEIDSAMRVVCGQPRFAMAEHVAAGARLLKALRERVKLSDVKAANFLHQLAEAMSSSTPVGACVRAARTQLFRSLTPAAAVKFAAAQSEALGKPVIRGDKLNSLAISVGKTAAAFRVPAYTVLSLQVALQKRSQKRSPDDHADAQRVAWAMLDELTPCAIALSMHGGGASSMESLVDVMLQSWAAGVTHNNERIIERLEACFGANAVAAMSANAPLPRFTWSAVQQGAPPPVLQLPRPAPQAPTVPAPGPGLLVQPPPAPRVFMSPAPRHALPPNKRHRAVAPAPSAVPFSPDMFFAEDDGEGAQPPPPPAGLPVPVQPQHKRTSKGLTAEERARLEAATAADRGQMTKERRAEVAAEVGLTPKQVQGWCASRWPAAPAVAETVRRRQQRRASRPDSDGDYEPAQKQPAPPAAPKPAAEPLVAPAAETQPAPPPLAPAPAARVVEPLEEPAEKQPALPLVAKPAARVAEPLDAVQRRLLAKAAARAAAVADAAAALAARSAAPQAAPEPVQQPTLAAAEPPAAEPSVAASEMHVDAPLPPPADDIDALPADLSIPPFALLPAPTPTAAGAAELLQAMVAELRAHGWVQPERLREHQVQHLLRSTPGAGALALWFWMQLITRPGALLPTTDAEWNGGLHRATLRMVHLCSSPPSGLALPPGVIIPSFARRTQPVAASVNADRLTECLFHVAEQGWVGPARLDPWLLTRLREPPTTPGDAMLALWRFFNDVLDTGTGLHLAPHKWSDAAAACLDRVVAERLQGGMEHAAPQPPPQPPPAAEPPSAQPSVVQPVATRPVADEPAQASPASAVPTALPSGVTIPAFALLPPADVAPGASEAVVQAMLVDMAGCGWIGPGRVDESAAARLRRWHLPCDAAVGLRRFMDEVLVRSPQLQLKPHLWGGTAIKCAGYASEARVRAAGDQPAPQALGDAAAVYATPAELEAAFASNALPRGVSLPPFARLPPVPSSPATDAAVLDAMLAELTACGWAEPGRLDQMAVHRLRCWRPAIDAIVGLRKFIEDVMVYEPNLQPRPQKWSGIAIKRTQRAGEARSGVAAAPLPRVQATDRGRNRSRSRSRSRERSRRAPDAPPTFAPPPAFARLDLPHGVTVPAFAYQPLPKLTHDVTFGLLEERLAQLTACGWAGPGRLDAEAIRRLRGWKLPSDAVIGLSKLMDDLLRREPHYQQQPHKWSGMAIARAKRASDARQAAADAAEVGGARVAGAGRSRSRSRERPRRSRSRERKRRSRSRSRDRKRHSGGRDERRHRSGRSPGRVRSRSRSRSRGRVRSRSRSRKRSRDRSRRAKEAPPRAAPLPHAAPPPPPAPMPAPPAPMPPAPAAPAAPAVPQAAAPTTSAASAPAARRKPPRYVCRDPTTNELWKAVKLSAYRTAVENGTISAAKAASTLFWREGADESTGVPLTTLLAQNPA